MVNDAADDLSWMRLRPGDFVFDDRIQGHLLIVACLRWWVGSVFVLAVLPDGSLGHIQVCDWDHTKLARAPDLGAPGR